MVECTGLENRRGGNSTVGSNPTSSATADSGHCAASMTDNGGIDCTGVGGFASQGERERPFLSSGLRNRPV